MDDANNADMQDSAQRIRDTTERILSGRTKDMPCPFCQEDKLEEEGSSWGTRWICPKCDKFIEEPQEK
jgi:hypothetical protein